MDPTSPQTEPSMPKPAGWNIVACPICAGRSVLEEGGLYDDRYGYPGKFDLRRCLSCGHRFIAAKFTNDELTQLYTRYYPRSAFKPEDWKPQTGAEGWRGWFNGEIRALSQVPENVRVLDIGCGYGESLGYHQSRGCDAYGVEADENIRGVADRYGLNVHVGIFDPSVYTPEFFDYVTMEQVLEHSVDPMQTLKGVFRVLKPGGTLAITLPNATGMGSRVFGRKWLHWHAPYHLQFFSRKSLRFAAEAVGFRLQSARTMTSSEWLFYQELHLLTFPEHGMPSLFWSPRRQWSEADPKMQRRRDLIQRWHRSKANHVLTRMLDLVGMGDNFLVVLRKQV